MLTTGRTGGAALAETSSPAATPTASAGADARSRKLREVYSEYFDVVRADTPDLIREAHRLRYQVYCVENPFENPVDHADGLERDEFDGHSVQSLLVHRATGTVAGTVRLILPQERRPGLGLPMFALCGDAELHSGRLVPSGSTAEISRFAISKAFRRRAEDLGASGAGPVLPPADERRVIPHITLGLMKAVAWMSDEYGITHLCAVMEPALIRLIGRFGINFGPVGPLVDYHGRRQPCYADVISLARGLRDYRPEALELITEAGKFHSRAVA